MNMKRVMALLLVVVLVFGLVAMGLTYAFAETTPDIGVGGDEDDDFIFEFDDLVDAQGTETNPIQIENAADLTSVAVKANGQTWYAVSSLLNGMVLTIAGNENTTVTLNDVELTADENGLFTAELTGTPANKLVVGNTGAADAEWVAAIEYAKGTEQNPIVINNAEELAGLTVPANGELYVLIAGTLSGKQLTVSAETGIAVNVNGVALTAGDYGFVTVLNGMPTNKVVLTNSTETAVEVYASITEAPGSEGNPYIVEWIWNEKQTEATASVTVPANTTFHCAAYVSGVELFVNGTSQGILTGSRWEPAKFTLVNDTAAEVTYELKIVVPTGSMENPAELVMGANTATIAAGAQGYFYTWTAEKDGTLTITMPTGSWTYTINNMTSYAYGDTQWSDSDPVVNPAKVEVKAGDELQIIVNTYDPANPWAAPAGTLTITAAFEEPIAKFDIDVARMILGNALEFQFGVAKTKIPDKTGFYAVIEKTWADGTTTEKTIPAAEWGVAGQYWAIVYDGLAAKEMGDTFYVTIYNADGVAVSNAKEDSVRAYVARAYASQKAAGKTMMVDMLNYGAAAQVHFNYGTDDLANNQLTDAQKAVGTATTPEMSNDVVKGTNYTGSRFILQSRIQVQVGFKGLTEDMYAIYTYTNNEGKVKEIRVEGKDFVDNKGTKIGVELSALVYSDARALVEITVYNADGTVYATASDSIESACARSTGDVFVALMKFADSAKVSLYG